MKTRSVLVLMFAPILIYLIATSIGQKNQTELHGLTVPGDGVYQVYASVPMFDPDSGKPVYWFLGSEVSIDPELGLVNHDEFRAYTIPRLAFGMTQASRPLPRPSSTARLYIVIKSGKAFFFRDGSESEKEFKSNAPKGILL